jgi:hypothetical protein
MRTFEKTYSTRDVVPLLVVEIGLELQGLVRFPQVSEHVPRSRGVGRCHRGEHLYRTDGKRRIAERQEVRRGTHDLVGGLTCLILSRNPTRRRSLAKLCWWCRTSCNTSSPGGDHVSDESVRQVKAHPVAPSERGSWMIRKRGNARTALRRGSGRNKRSADGA